MIAIRVIHQLGETDKVEEKILKIRDMKDGTAEDLSVFMVSGNGHIRLVSAQIC